MVLLVFLNKEDKNSQMLGRELPSFITGSYAKIYTRYTSKQYEQCSVEKTMSKIKEIVQIFDKVAISFGLRLFPLSAYKSLMDKHSKTTENIVFLKKLKGSKTWSFRGNKLTFDNYRIADAGLFILQARDINASKVSSFNAFIRELVDKDKLKYEWVPYWILTNRNSFKEKRRKK